MSSGQAAGDLPGLRIRPSIGIVGPCASGKSTLADLLAQEGFQAHQIVQEHSYVADMWWVLGKPDLLIFLDASFTTCSRRKALDWQEGDYQEQRRRLAHARQHCDLYIDTDALTAEQVLQITLRSLQALPRS